MSIEFARVIVFLALLYGALRLLVAPMMVFWRIGRIDASTTERSRGYRAVVLPVPALISLRPENSARCGSGSTYALVRHDDLLVFQTDPSTIERIER
jgi:hypothetical protein